MHHAVRVCAALGMAIVSWADAFASGSGISAPNWVALSPTLVTSGQPSADALSKLARQDFMAVIYLAPKTVASAVPGEEDIVRRQGLEFIHIPIPFGKPAHEHVLAFADAMKRLKNRKVLVHCELNMRASSMTFLYRVIVDHEKAEAAYEAVARIWSPEGAWKRLIVSELEAAHVNFEPY